MAPGNPLRVPRAASPDPGRSGRISRVRWYGVPASRPRKWSLIAAMATALAWSIAEPAVARQGNPPLDERRASADRHAARRAALERQRRGDAGAADVLEGAWPRTGYGAAQWDWPYSASWGWPYGGPLGWPHGALWSGSYAAPWSWPYGGAHIGATGSPGVFAAPFRSYGAARRWPRGWFGFDSDPERGFWCVAYPGERGRPSGERGRQPGGRGPRTWGCGPFYFPVAAPWWTAPPAWYRRAPNASADCAYVVVQVLYGGQFGGWVEPSRFGAEDLRELELAIDALLSEGHSLLLTTPDGFVVRVPAGLPIDTIRVAPCSAAARP